MGHPKHIYLPAKADSTPRKTAGKIGIGKEVLTVLSRKEKQEDEARQKFINALRRTLLRHKVAFEVTLDKNGNVIILLPGKFRRHEIRRINAAAGRAYERLWRHYQQQWIYAILHGAIAQSRLTKKTKGGVY